MPGKKPLPVQLLQLRPDDLKSGSGIGLLNQWMANVVNAVNTGNGVAGRTILPSGIDVAGSTVTGLGKPTAPTDAVSSSHADANYSAAALRSQLDVGGSQALKGLTAIAAQIGKGISGTVTLAKLTTGGSNGSLTFTNGIITAFTAPS